MRERERRTKEAETAEDGAKRTFAWRARVVADRVRDAGDDPSGRDDGGKLGEEQPVEEGEEGETGEVFESVLVYTLGAAVESKIQINEHQCQPQVQCRSGR